MPNLLILCEFATLNGGEQSLLAALDAGAADGLDVAMLAPPTGPLADAIISRGVDLVPFRTRGDTQLRRPGVVLRDELAALLSRRKPSLLHANSLSMGRLVGPVALELGVPSLGHLRDILGLSAQAVADLNCMGRLLTVSHATRDFHVAQGLEADRTQVLYNGVDLDRFRPRPSTGFIHRELQLPSDAQLIGTVGQIGLRKGLDTLVEAARLGAGRMPNAHWLVMGERLSDKEESRRFEADIRAAAAQGPLAGRLHLMGRRGDIADVLCELSMLVHPARQEPLGRVLLEAAAAGVPVVATEVGGTAEIFPPESEAALLVRPGDASALTEAMVALSADEVRRCLLSAAARRRAEACFDVRTAAQGLRGHYLSMLQGE